MQTTDWTTAISVDLRCGELRKKSFNMSIHKNAIKQCDTV